MKLKKRLIWETINLGIWIIVFSGICGAILVEMPIIIRIFLIGISMSVGGMAGLALIRLFEEHKTKIEYESLEKVNTAQRLLLIAISHALHGDSKRLTVAFENIQKFLEVNELSAKEIYGIFKFDTLWPNEKSRQMIDEIKKTLNVLANVTTNF